MVCYVCILDIVTFMVSWIGPTVLSLFLVNHLRLIQATIKSIVAAKGIDKKTLSVHHIPELKCKIGEQPLLMKCVGNLSYGALCQAIVFTFQSLERAASIKFH